MHQHTAPVALLWDESHLWGLLLHRALKALRAPLTLLKAEQIGAGVLRDFAPSTLIVPGGWARLKSLALGEDGRREIRDYVRSGGKYLGFCGGCGPGPRLGTRRALSGPVHLARKPASQRLPNFSGHVWCTVQDAETRYEAALPVWWPSQFAPDANCSAGCAGAL
jgi:Biotin-protein ligase, N terminal.